MEILQLSLGRWVLDFILFFMVIEWLIFGVLHHTNRVNISPRTIGAIIVPGFLLVLGFWLTDVEEIPLPAIACLAAAGLAHAWEIARRLRPPGA